MGDTESLIVCNRTSTGPAAVPSTLTFCAACGAGVWLADSSRAMMTRLAAPTIKCLPCAGPDLAAHEGALLTTDEQLAELAHRGVRRDHMTALARHLGVAGAIVNLDEGD